MAEYNPFKDYFGIRGQLFSEGTEENRRRSQQSDPSYCQATNSRSSQNPSQIGISRYNSRTEAQCSADEDLSDRDPSRFSQDWPNRGFLSWPFFTSNDCENIRTGRNDEGIHKLRSDPSSPPMIRSDPSSSHMIRSDPSSSPMIRSDPSSSHMIRSDPSSSRMIRSDPSSSPMIRSDPSSSQTRMIRIINTPSSPKSSTDASSSPKRRTDINTSFSSKTRSSTDTSSFGYHGYGRPILPQRLDLSSRMSSPVPDVRTFAEPDMDQKELVSTSTDLDFCGQQTTSFAGMMERLVHDAVEKKFTTKANRLSRPLCFFCQRNGETAEFYTTHMLKDNQGKVVCPVLRKYVCPKCRATGDNAHTLRHCPLSKNTVSVSETFKTPRTSCGIRKPPFY